MPDEVDKGCSGGTSQRHGSVHDGVDGRCQLVGHTCMKNNGPTKGHTAGMMYKGGGQLGCEGLQFVRGYKYCKGFVKRGLFHL